VATLLSQRFPGLPESDLQVLIESEVHALKQLSVVSAQPAAGSAQRAPAATPAPVTAES
jgi:hypothetical protein